jgi:hypothetical protein
MHPHLTAQREEGRGPERLGDDERALVLPPQRHLAPPRAGDHGNDRERAVADVLGELQQRHLEALRDRTTIAVVAIQKLDDRRRRGQFGGSAQRDLVLKGIDQPEAAVGAQGMRGAAHPAGLDPRQAEGVALDGIAHRLSQPRPPRRRPR